MIRSTSCCSHFLFPVWVAKEMDVWQEEVDKQDSTDKTHISCVSLWVFLRWELSHLTIKLVSSNSN